MKRGYEKRRPNEWTNERKNERTKDSRRPTDGRTERTNGRRTDGRLTKERTNDSRRPTDRLTDRPNERTNKLMFLNIFSVLLPTGFEIPKIVCASPLGMENGKIPDSAIVASTRYNQWWGPERGRLNEKKEGNVFCLRMCTIKKEGFLKDKRTYYIRRKSSE